MVTIGEDRVEVLHRIDELSAARLAETEASLALCRRRMAELVAEDEACGSPAVLATLGQEDWLAEIAILEKRRQLLVEERDRG